MRKNTVLAAVTSCVIVLSAIAYGVYINVSSSTHLNQMRRTTGAGLLFAPAERRDVTPVLRAVLTLEPGWKADVYANTDGRIERIMVKEGDQVAAGTLVAVTESRELEAQIKQARGNVYSSKANLEQAESEFKRAQFLIAQDAVSALTMDGIRFKKETALGQLRSAEGSLEQVLAKSDSTNVIAPHAGVVLKRYVGEGSYARAGLALVHVGDITTLKATVPVGTLYIGVLSQGAVVGINISGIAGVIEGRVTAITTSTGLPPGSMLAEISVDNPSKLLQPGVYSQTEIKGSLVKSALVIPEQAVITRDRQQQVYVVGRDKYVKLRTIRTGYSGEGWTIVLEGLQDGETVVTHGQDGLTDGMMVDMVKGRSNDE